MVARPPRLQSLMRGFGQCVSLNLLRRQVEGGLDYNKSLKFLAVITQAQQRRNRRVLAVAAVGHPGSH
jgi:hypothetical protein